MSPGTASTPKQLICPLPRNDPLVPLLPRKAGNEVLGQRDARIDRILDRDCPNNDGQCSRNLRRSNRDIRAGKPQRLCRMPCLLEVMGVRKPHRHALALGKVCNERRVHPARQCTHTLVAAEPHCGDDCLFQRQVRNRGINLSFDHIVADERPFRAVAPHDPEMVPGPAAVTGEEEFAAEPEYLFRAVL